jgi:hypothetical protein
MKKIKQSQTWWHTTVIPALRRLRLLNHEFEASLGYITKTYLKNKIK